LFSDATNLDELQWGHPQQGHQTDVGQTKIDNFRPIPRYISETEKQYNIGTKSLQKKAN